MLFKINDRTRHTAPTRNENQVLNESTAPEKAELRRLMYERIAQGNALFDAEETARRRWQGK